MIRYFGRHPYYFSMIMVRLGMEGWMRIGPLSKGPTKIMTSIRNGIGFISWKVSSSKQKGRSFILPNPTCRFPSEEMKRTDDQLSSSLWNRRRRSRTPFDTMMMNNQYFSHYPLLFSSLIVCSNDGSRTNFFRSASFHDTRSYSDARGDEWQKNRHTRRGGDRWKAVFRPLFDTKSIGWTRIPIGLGIVYLCVLELYRIIEHEKERSHKEEGASLTLGSPDDIVIEREPWQVTFLRKLPLRAISRVWGVLTHTDLPESIREFVYRTWAHVFESDLSEAEQQDLRAYRNLAEFFVRRLKSGSRPIDGSLVVSPADGRILHFGAVTDGWLEQVKGVRYRLENFFGYEHRLELDDAHHSHESFVALSLKDGKPMRVDHRLYYCVIYLAPGDYHRFHSPTNWNVYSRRHFPGDLLSVSPGFLKLIRGVFVYNERVAMLGEWAHGFFSMTAVGATNVGSIRIHFDEDLRTNLPRRRHHHHLASGDDNQLRDDHQGDSRGKQQPESSLQSIDNQPSTTTTATTPSPLLSTTTKNPVLPDKSMTITRFYISKDYTESHGGHPIHLLKGVEMGAFHLGSSIVLVFEAPSTFEFGIRPNQKIRLGAALGDIRIPVIPIDGSIMPPELSGKETPIKAVTVSGTSIADTTTSTSLASPS
jgi:phosphatidylserine decarboxylase